MNARITTIAVCALVAAMNQASAPIVDVDTELRALASSELDLENWNLREIDERTAAFFGYGSFHVSAQTEVAWADVTAHVQPSAIGIQTQFSMEGSSEGYPREGTATATVNFKLSEAGVWSAKPVASPDQPSGLRRAEVSLLREVQEVYHQDCSGDFGLIYCDPYYTNHEIIANPDYVGTSLELQQGDYTLLLTAREATIANNSAGGEFNFDLQLVPVPAALPLFISALAAFGLVGWRRR